MAPGHRGSFLPPCAAFAPDFGSEEHSSLRRPRGLHACVGRGTCRWCRPAWRTCPCRLWREPDKRLLLLGKCPGVGVLGRMGTVCLTCKELQPSPVASQCAFPPAAGQGSGRSAAFVGKTALPACVSFAALSKGSCFCLWGTFHVVCLWPLEPRCLGSLELRERPLLGQPRIGSSFGTKCSVRGRTTRASAPRSRAASTQRRGHWCRADTAATWPLLPRRQRHSLLLCGLTEQHQSLFVGPPRAQRSSCDFTRGTARAWVRPDLDRLGCLRAVCLDCSVRYSCNVFPLKAAVALHFFLLIADCGTSFIV